MPARRVSRCPRHAGHDRLALVDELHLVYWQTFLPGHDFPSLEAMRAAWTRHGDRITANYIRQLPGQRPFALYALGLVPLPELRHQPSRFQDSRTLDGIRFWSPWHYFGTRTGEAGHYCAGAAFGEFEHLRALGLVDKREAALAAGTIDDRHYAPGRPCRTYQTLARD